ncbi:hypothetical protein CYMTET_50031 [Cymbomonas tetramitiformis]|uniref:Uncharacterized protein n=1 Tax=Cymbomonas tetramitiformis TaxID=36881 RepID=A0AAE0BNX4_9CHLO|nr:hypothetical protein CYMTET_50031 [Cymbomonas tetramitiformis]
MASPTGSLKENDTDIYFTNCLQQVKILVRESAKTYSKAAEGDIHKKVSELECFLPPDWTAVQSIVKESISTLAENFVSTLDQSERMFRDASKAISLRNDSLRELLQGERVTMAKKLDHLRRAGEEEVRNTEQQVNATWQRTWDLQIKAYKDHDAELTADHAQMALKLAVAEATLKVTEKERMDAEQRLDYLKAQMSAERQAALKEMNQLESSLTIQIETLQEQLVREKERMAAQMKEERVSIQQGMLRDRVLSEKELQRQVEEERAKSAELQSNLKKLMQNTNDQNRIDVVKDSSSSVNRACGVLDGEAQLGNREKLNADATHNKPPPPQKHPSPQPAPSPHPVPQNKPPRPQKHPSPQPAPSPHPASAPQITPSPQPTPPPQPMPPLQMEKSLQPAPSQHPKLASPSAPSLQQPSPNSDLSPEPALLQQSKLSSQPQPQPSRQPEPSPQPEPSSEPEPYKPESLPPALHEPPTEMQFSPVAGHSSQFLPRAAEIKWLAVDTASADHQHMQRTGFLEDMGEVAPTPMLPSAAFQATGQDIVGASLDQSSPKPAQPTAKCRNCESSESTRSLQMQALEEENHELRTRVMASAHLQSELRALQDELAYLTSAGLQEGYSDECSMEKAESLVRHRSPHLEMLSHAVSAALHQVEANSQQLGRKLSDEKAMRHSLLQRCRSYQSQMELLKAEKGALELEAMGRLQAERKAEQRLGHSQQNSMGVAAFSSRGAATRSMASTDPRRLQQEIARMAQGRRRLLKAFIRQLEELYAERDALRLQHGLQLMLDDACSSREGEPSPRSSEASERELGQEQKARHAECPMTAGEAAEAVLAAPKAAEQELWGRVGDGMKQLLDVLEEDVGDEERRTCQACPAPPCAVPALLGPLSLGALASSWRSESQLQQAAREDPREWMRAGSQGAGEGLRGSGGCVEQEEVVMQILATRLARAQRTSTGAQTEAPWTGGRRTKADGRRPLSGHTHGASPIVQTTLRPFNAMVVRPHTARPASRTSRESHGQGREPGHGTARDRQPSAAPHQPSSSFDRPSCSTEGPCLEDVATQTDLLPGRSLPSWSIQHAHSQSLSRTGALSPELSRMCNVRQQSILDAALASGPPGGADTGRPSSRWKPGASGPHSLVGEVAADICPPNEPGLDGETALDTDLNLPWDVRDSPSQRDASPVWEREAGGSQRHTLPKATSELHVAPSASPTLAPQASMPNLAGSRPAPASRGAHSSRHRQPSLHASSVITSHSARASHRPRQNPNRQHSAKALQVTREMQYRTNSAMSKSAPSNDLSSMSEFTFTNLGMMKISEAPKRDPEPSREPGSLRHPRQVRPDEEEEPLLSALPKPSRSPPEAQGLRSIRAEVPPVHHQAVQDHLLSLYWRTTRSSTDRLVSARIAPHPASGHHGDPAADSKRPDASGWAVQAGVAEEGGGPGGSHGTTYFGSIPEGISIVKADAKNTDHCEVVFTVVERDFPELSVVYQVEGGDAARGPLGAYLVVKRSRAHRRLGVPVAEAEAFKARLIRLVEEVCAMLLGNGKLGHAAGVEGRTGFC